MWSFYFCFVLYLLVRISLLLEKKLPRACACNFKWSFLCHCTNFASLVVLTLLGGAEHTRVIWDLASVTCLGIFLRAAHEL